MIFFPYFSSGNGTYDRLFSRTWRQICIYFMIYDHNFMQSRFVQKKKPNITTSLCSRLMSATNIEWKNKLFAFDPMKNVSTTTTTMASGTQRVWEKRGKKYAGNSKCEENLSKSRKYTDDASWITVPFLSLSSLPVHGEFVDFSLCIFVEWHFFPPLKCFSCEIYRK